MLSKALIPSAFVLITALAFASAAEAQRSRGATAQSVHRPAAGANVDRNVNRNANVNRNVNVNRDVNIDVDQGWNGHPVAAGMAVGAAAAVTAAVVGSVVYSLPPSCETIVANGVTYSRCGSTWYEPRYAGTSVTYVVVNNPS